jgi:regulatory protein YycI of two-component signal transduction system YycFG
MKKIYLLLVLSILFTINIFAQTPEKLSYQAIVRDNSDMILASQNIGMQISILEGSSSGTAIYVENQSPTTKALTLLKLKLI